MAKIQNYSNVNVTLNDQNDSFVPNKNVRSVTVRYTPEENSFTLTTPAPQVKSDPVPPIYEITDYGMALNKQKKGYKLTWDVNIKATKIAGIRDIKKGLGQCVDAMFEEIKAHNL